MFLMRLRKGSYWCINRIRKWAPGTLWGSCFIGILACLFLPVIKFWLFHYTCKMVAANYWWNFVVDPNATSIESDHVFSHRIIAFRFALLNTPNLKLWCVVYKTWTLGLFRLQSWAEYFFFLIEWKLSWVLESVQCRPPGPPQSSRCSRAEQGTSLHRKAAGWYCRALAC